MRYVETYAPIRSRSFTAVILMIGVVAALVMTRFALQDNYLPLVSVYALGFMAFAWKRRTLAMAFIYCSALFPWDIGGGEGSSVAVGIGEGHLMFITLLLVVDFAVNRWPMPQSPIYVPVIIYLAICTVSAMYTWRGNPALISLIQMVLYFLVATSVFSNFLPYPEQHRRVLVAVVFGGVFLAFALMISYVFFGHSGSNANYVLGMHKNAIGGALSYAITVCLELWFATPPSRKKGFMSLALAIILVGLILSLSRGAWLGAITGLAIIILLRGQIGLMIRSLFILVPIAIVCYQLLPEESRDYALNFDTGRTNILARLESIDFAQSNFAQAPLIGVGVGLRKTYDATNVIWLTLAETGILGALGFAAIHVTFLIMVIKARKRLSPSDPRFSLLAVGTALVFGKLVHGCVDHYWSRGSLLVVWGGAGMAIAAYYSSLRNPDRSSTQELMRL